VVGGDGGSGRSSDQRRREPDVTESSQPTVSDLRDRLESAREEERWSEAMEFLEGLTSRVADPEAKAEFAYSAGVIARDELDQPGRAVTWFDAALDHDVMKLEAFEAIDRILTDQEEWKGLEQAHRRQLSRIVEQAERPATGLKAKIWKSLGHIYAERLEHPQSARTALQTASELTDDPEIEEMLEGLR